MAIFAPVAVASTVGTTVVSTATSAFMTALAPSLLQAAIGVGLNLLAQTMLDTPAGIKGQMRRGADLPLSFVLGHYATAGSLAYANTWGRDGGLFKKTPNAYLTQVIALSDLPVKGLDGLWVNGARATLLTGEPHASYGVPVDEFRKGSKDYLWVKFYDGTQTAADSFLTDTVATTERPWDSNAKFTGTAYAIVTARMEDDLWQGFPTFLFEVDGVKLYDPSKDSSVGGSGTHRWDTPSTWGGDGDYLPIVQLYNLWRGFTYGGEWLFGFQGVAGAQLPVADWIAAIGKCRAAIAHPEGGTVPTYVSGFEVLCGPEGSNDIAAAAEQILAACHGRIAENGGTYKPHVGAPGAAVATITDADILSSAPQTFTPHFGLSDAINGIVVKYPDPEQGWQVEGEAAYYNADYEAEDGGRRLLKQITLASVTDPFQVQRLQKSAIEEARRQRRHSITLPPTWRGLEAGDVIAWTSARNGYVAKLFRIDGAIALPIGDIACDVTEVDPDDFDFDPDTEYTAPVRGSVAPQPVPAQEVPDFAAAATTVGDGSAVDRRPAIAVTWEPDGFDDVRGLEVEVRVAATEEKVTVARVDNTDDGSVKISAGILPNETYDVRARAVPGSARASDWTTWTEVTTGDVRVDTIDLADRAATDPQISEIASPVALGWGSFTLIDSITMTIEGDDTEVVVITALAYDRTDIGSENLQIKITIDGVTEAFFEDTSPGNRGSVALIAARSVAAGSVAVEIYGKRYSGAGYTILTCATLLDERKR